MRFVLSGLLALSPLASPVRAGPGSQAVREAAEFVTRKFGKEVAAEGAEVFARRLGRAALTHGDDVLNAARKCGPRAVRLIEEAGEHGAKAAGLLARHGERAAVAVVSRPSAMKLVARYGDDAAEACVRHVGLAEPLIARHGPAAAQALVKLTPASGRRLAMLSEGGELVKIGRTGELLRVVGRFGDAGLDWIWRNKGKLLVGTALAAFLADPEPFITGAVELTHVAVDATVQPLADAAGRTVEHAVSDVTGGIARHTHWTLVLVVLVVAVTTVALVRRRRATRPG